ncbi:cadmium-exporting ATPase [Sphingobacterium spiritivorum ATCC 33300]|uniref:P-type Zn(2+) transporter n=1 Tax=Sphingobacterium spiritivorum ATCC 33300 TaxID=525372 RepID=C2FXR9_SPHSI|nr:cation-translocating P-type ATPase [Sphingobacterium spiritivorum]EEI92281.1 cadmium-exporting ATPase [Sphingobacterium spiritivorum ATCC 33300]
MNEKQIISNVASTGMSVIAASSDKEKPWYKQKRSIFLFINITLAALGFAFEKGFHNEVIAKTLYALAILIGGYYPARNALIAFWSFTLNINTLLVVAALGAIFLNLWEEAAVLVAIFSLGEVLEAIAVDKARGSIRALMDLTPPVAMLVSGLETREVPVEQLKIGDIILIKPGDKIPMDGEVVSGTSAVDQSSITGEAIPVAKSVGDSIFAGTFNQRGALEIRVTKLSSDTTIAKIIHSVEEAQNKKSSYQNFGERFGRVFTPLMFALAILVVVIPPIFFDEPFREWLYKGLILLVVSCSCGLVLSVPVTVIAAIGNASKNGILVKGGIYLEAISRIQAIAFDKTGTLTQGKPVITHIQTLAVMPEMELLQIIASIEAKSEHPLATAILTYTSERGIMPQPVSDFEALTGLGAKAAFDNKTYYIGSPGLFRNINLDITSVSDTVSNLQNSGNTVMLISSEHEVIGLIAVADKVRPEARETLNRLEKLGVRHLIMLTGDNHRTAKAISKEIGLKEFQAELLPDDKVTSIQELQRKYGKVAMVGDGVNDAPSLALADAGIAMGGIGTDVALETGDIVLMGDGLKKLPSAILLGRKTISNVKQNIIASLVVVVFLIIGAIAGYINLYSGIVLNELSALIVIANGLRLYRIKI